MCGRFETRDDPLARFVLDIINAPLPPLHFENRYNVAPTEPIQVVLKSTESDWELREMRWWLIPFWSKEPSTRYAMFNAKSETLATSRAFKEPFRRRRCIVPASGYYEWSKVNGVKVPYHIEPAEEEGFAFAALWDRWHGGDTVVESCTIITGPAPDSMKVIHHRVPVHLTREAAHAWLDLESPEKSLLSLLSTAVHTPVAVTPVSSYVNNSRHKDKRCIEPLGDTRVIR